MEPQLVVTLVVAVVVIGGAIAFMLWRRRQSEGLRDRFGPEYEREVDRTGDQRAAERELRAREERRRKQDIRPLPADVRDRYHEQWAVAQKRFVDEPENAVREAHKLVTDLMRDRGYPMEDFEQRAADISVDHPEVVEDYRAATRIAMDTEARQADTESLRQAMVHFRALFDRLLQTSTDAGTEVR